MIYSKEEDSEMDNEKLKAIESYVKRNIVYDGDGWERCPKCDKVLKEGTTWIKRPSSLTSGVVDVLMPEMDPTVKSAIHEIILGVVKNYSSWDATGKATTDSKALAKRIYNTVYGLEDAR